ncbi:MAG: serine/threonine protein kinase [Methylobacterium sp.]|nr:MAG: serine/threonine protein kinase [Methylobacterium sp.]
MKPLEPGQTIAGLQGTFQVVRRCGEGGFGLTFEARDERGQPVALKQLRFERLRDWKALELFEREGRALARLRHPAIPAYVDFFAHDGVAPCAPAEAASRPGALSWVIAQQFVAGDNLQHGIDAGVPLPPARGLDLLTQLLEALVYLHAQSPPVIHRDINPKNVLWHASGRVYLVDFGAIQDGLRAADAHGSTTVGTLGYMPLEQLRGAARPASDLYALGMTIVAAAAGRNPSALPTDEASGKVRVDEVLTGWPAAARRVVDRMIEPLLGPRLASAAEALAMLRQPMEAPDRAAAPRAPVAPAGDPSGLSYLALGFIVIMLGGVALSFVMRRPARPTRAATTTSARVAPPPPTVAPPPVATAEPGRPFHLVWPATVVSATGAGLTAGARCTLTTDGLATEAEGFVSTTLVVRCGEHTLYDSSESFNGTSSLSFGFEEAPAKKPGEFTYALAYSDIGSRTGRAQVSLDTRASEAVLWRETVPTMRVVLAIKNLSRPGEPVLERNRTRGVIKR